MEFYAHIDKKGVEEPILDHLTEVAETARLFGSKFNAGDIAYACGQFHDIGKATLEFDERLHGGLHRVDHSTAGAQLVHELWQANPLVAYIVSHCIASHHTGLLNLGNFHKRLEKQIPKVLWYPPGLLDTNPPSFNHAFTNPKFGLAFFLRMVFSCLVDADFIRTEHCMRPRRAKIRGEQKLDPAESLQHLLSWIEELPKKHKSKSRPYSSKIVADVRSQVLEDCLQAAKLLQGIFSLTVPTGGGKTLASLAFALQHAALHSLDRIIYAVPYISITEQIVDIFNEIFPGKVLEHHSNIDLRRQTVRERLATENWDKPIIVTTTVQLFESLYGSRTSTCRKLHNIARSVIILDEAQMLPPPVLLPCLEAIKELTANYGTSVVLCTATQPAIIYRNNFRIGLKNVTEIATDPKKMHKIMRRTNIKHIGDLSPDELCDRLKKHDTSLCVVNGRKAASKLFTKLSKHRRRGIYHLSTYLCGMHRSRVVNSIRKRLLEEKPCQVISTAVIQAGVDLDFRPVVYREWIGLDSINQVAGRCNRNGLDPIGYVYTFLLHGEYRQADMEMQCQIARTVYYTHYDMQNLDAIYDYFCQLYGTVNSTNNLKHVDHHDIGRLCTQRDFRDIAKHMRLIQKATHPVLVPYMGGKKIIEQLAVSTDNVTKEMKRKMQRYIIPLYDKDLEDGIKSGAIVIYPSPDPTDDEDLDVHGLEGYAVLKPEYYDSKLGFNLAASLATVD